MGTELPLTFRKEGEGEEMASLRWVFVLGVRCRVSRRPWALGGEGVAASRLPAPATLGPRCLCPCSPPGRPRPGRVKGHSERWLPDRLPDSRPVQGCGGQAASAVTRESWEADRAWAGPHRHCGLGQEPQEGQACGRQAGV